MKAVRVAGAAIALVALGLLTALWPLACGAVERWRAGGSALEQPAPAPEVAQPSRRARKARRQPVPPAICSGLTEIADAELLAEVARRHRLPDLDPRRSGEIPGDLAAPEVRRSLLDLVETRQRAPWGVEAAITLAPGERVPKLSVVPLEPPIFAWTPRLRTEFGGGAILAGEGAPGDLAVYGALDWRFAQTGRLDHGLRVAGIASGSDAVVFAGYVAGWE